MKKEDYGFLSEKQKEKNSRSDNKNYNDKITVQNVSMQPVLFTQV